MTPKSIGTDYGWKEICVSNLQQVFAETRLEDVDLSNIIPRISPPPPRPGACTIWRGDLSEGFLRYDVGGLYLEGIIHRGARTYYQCWLLRTF